MPFSSADIQRWISNAILTIDVPLAGYAYYLLLKKAETMTGPIAFETGTSLMIPAMFWGIAMGSHKPAWLQADTLNFATVCLVSLLFSISWANQSTLLTIAAGVILVGGLVWNWLGKRDEPAH